MAEGNDLTSQGLQDLNVTQQSGVRYLGLIIQTLQKAFIQFGGRTSTATAGTSGAPPAQVAGYISFTAPDGTVGKVPYYNS